MTKTLNGAPIREPYEPSTPEEARFDRSSDAWVLSRYREVSAALREPLLLQASAKTRKPTGGNVDLHKQLYDAVKKDMDRIGSAAWRLQIREAMGGVLHGIKTRQELDIVRDILQPWSIATLAAVEGATAGSKRTATTLGRRLSYASPERGPQSATAEVLARMTDAVGNWQAKRADRKLDQLLQQGYFVSSKPMFLGLTQTLPGFLAKAWLALLRHPDQMALLIKKPSLAPVAAEELLRYAGTVHTVFRCASARVKVGNIWVEEGQCMYLKIDSANFDPSEFDNPYRLDLTRQVSGHFALGAGVHSCVGAVLVRIACMILLPMIAESALALDESRPIAWTCGSSLQWPLSIPARLAAS